MKDAKRIRSGGLTNYVMELADGTSVVTWHDSDSGNWITQRKDAKGAQMGEADYSGTRRDAELTHSAAVRNARANPGPVDTVPLLSETDARELAQEYYGVPFDQVRPQWDHANRMAETRVQAFQLFECACETVHRHGGDHRPLFLNYEVQFAGEREAGLSPFSETVRVTVLSGQPGGESGEFVRELEQFLREWFDGAEVIETRVSRGEVEHG